MNPKKPLSVVGFEVDVKVGAVSTTEDEILKQVSAQAIKMGLPQDQFDVWDVTDGKTEPEFVESFDTMDEAKQFVAVGMVVHHLTRKGEPFRLCIRTPAQVGSVTRH